MKQSIFYQLFAFLFCFSGCASAQEEPESYLMKQIVTTTKLNHFQPKQLDDSLSVLLFNYFIDQLDPNQLLFSQQELKEVEKFKLELDDHLLEASPIFVNKITPFYHDKIKEAKKIVDSLFKLPMNLSWIESRQPDQIPNSRPNNYKALVKRWEQEIRIRFNEAYYYQTTVASTNNSKNDQMKMALVFVRNTIEEHLNKMKSNSQQTLLENFLNAYLALNDPQSKYLSQEEKAKWDNAFNRSYVGIGILFEKRHGLTTITRIIPNGPAWKNKKLKANDVIVSILISDNKYIPTQGLSVEKILELLKGPAHSTIEMIVFREGEQNQKIQLKREKLQMELTHSFILASQELENSVGYIRLPRFYSGENSSSNDLMTHLIALKEQSINSLVLDLRDNHGGSAREAIQIISFFLEGGPVMRASYRTQETRIFNDPDSTALFEGKLAVLVNSNSSSASELTAGTLQDYGRAIIIGSESTYGKGTIQRFFPMNNDSISNLGEIKLSIGQFYTAAGRSNEYYGIKSDIRLPDQSSFLKSGARAHPLSKPSEIKNLTIYPINNLPFQNLEKLRTESQARTQNNKLFKTQLQKNKGNKKTPLNWSEYKLFRETLKQNSNVTSKPVLQIIHPNLGTLSDALQENAKKIERDSYILESCRILEALN